MATADDNLAEIRASVRALCARFQGEYWRKLDRERDYPTEFVTALTDAGFNKETAAAALRIHRNTMRGRLQRLQTLLGRSLDDPTLRRDLAVSKEIEHLLGSGG